MDVMDTLTAPQLAEALQEPNTALLSKVLRLLGQERCSAALAAMVPLDHLLRASGEFGPAVPVAGNASPQDRLVAFHLPPATRSAMRPLVAPRSR